MVDIKLVVYRMGRGLEMHEDNVMDSEAECKAAEYSKVQFTS